MQCVLNSLDSNCVTVIVTLMAFSFGVYRVFPALSAFASLIQFPFSVIDSEDGSEIDHH